MRAGQAPKIETDLTARVRALYENSVVPVCEIAAMAGVSERTIYKYARTLRWKPRYAWMPDGSRPPGRPGRGRYTIARQLKHAEQFAPVKGAGGRFIRRADKEKPVAHGLKATDPAAAARTAAECAEAERLARAAQVEAEEERRSDECLRALNAVTRATGNLADYRAERARRDKQRYRASLDHYRAYGGRSPPPEMPKPPANDPVERALEMNLRAALDWLEAARAEAQRAEKRAGA